MSDDILFYKRCAFDSKLINGHLDLSVLRGSTNESIIQQVVEDFFDTIFIIESSMTDIQKEKELKEFEVIGWAGGSSILKVMVDAKGGSILLAALQMELPKLAFGLARKLDLSMRYNPDRIHRFLW